MGMLTKQQYFSQIDKIIKVFDKKLQDGAVNDKAIESAQAILDKYADRFQYDESMGSQRYKLYELQALICLSRGQVDDANSILEEAGKIMSDKDVFISETINHYGSNRENLNHSEGMLPLEFQAMIKGLRTSAIIMAVLSIISIYFIPWGLFYIYLSTELKYQQVPSKKLVRAAAILTLPLCAGIIPIMIDIEFWRMNKKIKEFEELGSKAFVADKKWLEDDPKRKRSRKTAWVVLLLIVVIFATLIIIAIASQKNSPTLNSSSQSSTSLASQSAQEAKSSLNLPNKVDNVTTLTDITSEGNTIQYHYIIHDADTSNLSDDSLRNSIKPSVCNNSSSKDLLNKAISFQYIYVIKETNQQYGFTVAQGDC